ncbi:MAG: response regulator [Myxococcaceae bacterium]|nr:response regulator [Myxococcaceae bacterium]
MKGRYDGPPPSAQASQKPVVLVVDDDPNNLKLVSASLTLEGYEVVCASSGEEGLETLARRSIDLLLLDVRMPGLDGIEVCRRVRAQPRFSRMPIVFLTADQADTERTLLGLDAGGDEYLHKPISRRMLSARVRNLLRLANAERERQLLTQVAQAEKLAAVGQVAAGVAHEVNNPLSFILSNLESLRAYVNDLSRVVQAYRVSPETGAALDRTLGIDALMADVKPLLDETVQGGSRVRAIVQELKTFARQDPDTFEPVDLAEVARCTLVLTERELSSKATLVKELKLARVELAPRQKLHQVMLNLLVNAMHAIEARPVTGQRHTITVSTRTEGDVAVLEVSDTGCGIPQSARSRIFEPFFTTKPVGIGTGLGLSVCAMVVDRLGGRIDVVSEVGRGTTFTIRVPCDADERSPQGQLPRLQVAGAR